MNQNYSASYAAALNAATAELDGLFEQAKALRNRMEQVDEVISALKPLMPGSEPSYGQDLGSSSSKEKFDAALGLAYA